MSRTHRHQEAINILRREMCKIGGELFEHEFVEQAIYIRDNNGDDAAKVELGMKEFMDTLFNNSEAVGTTKRRFVALCNALIVLIRDE